MGTNLTCRLGTVLGSPSTAGIVQNAPNSLSLGTAPNTPWLSSVSILYYTPVNSWSINPTGSFVEGGTP